MLKFYFIIMAKISAFEKFTTLQSETRAIGLCPFEQKTKPRSWRGSEKRGYLIEVVCFGSIMNIGTITLVSLLFRWRIDVIASGICNTFSN
jgi:hypothetical protein